MLRRFLLASQLACATFACVGSASAANILWASDSPPNLGFSGPLSGLTDQGFVKLLQDAGHNVDRYDNPEAATTLMTQADIDQINTYDLIILGRAGGSGQFQTGQGDQWNTLITKPLICMSPYFVRPDGGRFAWFTGGTLPDDMPTPVTAANASLAAVDYLLSGVAMLGNSTVENYDELLDRNTSHITNPLEPTGRALITATFPTEANNASIVTATVVADFPAGAAVRGGAQMLGGYRMYFAGGSREGATAPNAIPLYTGRENLTKTGEDIFLRAVQLALNQGVPPAANPSAPPVITQSPASVTVSEGGTATFSVASTGAAPRTLQWQRDTGDGVTFVDLPASTPFLNSRLTLTNVTLADNNARFRVRASNGNGTDISAVATLTVAADTAPPVPVSVGSIDGNTITVCFNELLDNRPDDAGNSATDEFNYSINGADNPLTTTIQPDGKTVVMTLNTPVSGAFTVSIVLVQDRLGNAMPDNPPTTLSGTVLGLTTIGVGAVNPGGSVVACAPNVFDVNGGGLDLGINATTFTDSFQFAYKSVNGNFDARARVHSIIGIGRHESVAKAILTARQTTDAGSPAVNVFVTPQAPGDDVIASSVRPATGVNTNSLGSFIPGGLPGNAWMRITRSGDVFTTFRSVDGNVWTQLGSTTVVLPPTLVVGVGAASHRNTFLTTARFSDFSVAALVQRPTLTNPALSGTTFSASFGTEAGVTYVIQYKNSLSDPNWQTLQTINGDGTAQSISDAGANVPNRFYRISVQ